MSESKANIQENFIGTRGSSLSHYGYNEETLQDFIRFARPEEIPARVVAVHKDRVDAVFTGTERRLPSIGKALVPGHGCFRPGDTLDSPTFPVTGDWIALRQTGGSMAMECSADEKGAVVANDGSTGYIVSWILPRRTALVRRASGDSRFDGRSVQILAANVDIMLIVTAAGCDFSLRRIERFATLAAQAGIAAISVITKTDLLEDPEEAVRSVSARCPGMASFGVCAPEGRGMQELAASLAPGKTIVLAGSSGAGKSTLLNALAGKEIADTGGVRLSDQKGRHTTSRRELHLLDSGLMSGLMVIDTPGLREVALWADEDDIDAAFPDIALLADKCRFRDCRHLAEPGCAVREAVDRGSLDPARLEARERLLREVERLDRKADPLAKREERRIWKSRNKDMKELERMRGGGDRWR